MSLVATRRQHVRARLAASAALTLSITAFGACSSPTSDPASVVVTPTPPAAELERAPAPPPAPPIGDSALPPRVEAPKRLPIRSTTPGKVQCETLDCDLATEVCCYYHAKNKARCVPNDGPSPLCDENEELRNCDEASDCPGGANCCLEWIPERRVCNPLGCGQTGDPSRELCLPGSECAQGACRAHRSPLQGRCPPNTPPMACGSRRCAAGEICFWDPDARKGTCAKSELESPMGARQLQFYCRSPADCATGECFNTTALYDRQIYTCDVSKGHIMSAFIGPFLCRSSTDCPHAIKRTTKETSSRTYHFTDCSADKDFPPGVKVCHYRPGLEDPPEDD